MNLKYYLRKSKDIGLKEYVSVFPMIFAAALRPFFQKRYKETWVICEREDEARDNGYHFYKYMCEHDREQECIYLIKKNCPDYSKVKDLGTVAEYGGLKHWILYFTGEFLISSVSCKPNGYLCTLLERSRIFQPHHVFLQHGVTINRPEYLYADRRKVDFFLTAAKPETDFVRDNLGYEHDAVQMTGFARFDALHEFTVHKNRILIMPTWRKWLKLKSETHKDAQKDMVSSEYFQKWVGLLNSERLSAMIENDNLEVIFYPHPNLKKIIHLNSYLNGNVAVADSEEDIQELMKSSAALITDYSSVFFDMVYMKKPVLFYQFDEEKFRKYHYKQGWFDYHKSAFGKSFSDPDALLKELESLIKKNYAVSEKFELEHKRVFSLYDNRNCYRIYKLLKSCRGKK